MAIPPFVKNLWDVVNDPTVTHIVSWDSDGCAVVVHDVDQFVATVMPRVVKSPSFCAFVRQLNGYGFSKSDPKRAAFKHSSNLFVQGHPELLPAISRRKPATKRNEAPSVRARRAEAGGGSDAEEDEEDGDDVGHGEHSDTNEPVTTTHPAPPPVNEAHVMQQQQQQQQLTAKLPQMTLSLEDFARQFGLTYAPVAAEKEPKTAPTAELSDADLKAELTLYKEMVVDALTTLQEVVAANKRELWADGTASNLVNMTVANFLRNQSKSFPQLHQSISSLPAATKHADVVKVGLPTLSAEIAAGSITKLTPMTESLSPLHTTAYSRSSDSVAPMKDDPYFAVLEHDVNSLSSMSCAETDSLTGKDDAPLLPLPSGLVGTFEEMLSTLPDTTGSALFDVDEAISQNLLMAEAGCPQGEK